MKIHQSPIAQLVTTRVQVKTGPFLTVKIHRLPRAQWQVILDQIRIRALPTMSTDLQVGILGQAEARASLTMNIDLLMVTQDQTVIRALLTMKTYTSLEEMVDLTQIIQFHKSFQIPRNQEHT
jgi:hypothetical protein